MIRSPASTRHLSESPDTLAAERKARRFWVTLIVGFLSIQVIIGLGTVYLALGDPTVAVIPNYHQSALDWDVTHRERETLRRLGWQVQTFVSPAESGWRQLNIRVSSARQRPVEDLRVKVSLFHRARGSEIYEATLQEIEPGLYATALSLTRAGIWQINLSLEGDHGIASDRIEVVVN